MRLSRRLKKKSAAREELSKIRICPSRADRAKQAKMTLKRKRKFRKNLKERLRKRKGWLASKKGSSATNSLIWSPLPKKLCVKRVTKSAKRLSKQQKQKDKKRKRHSRMRKKIKTRKALTTRTKQQKTISLMALLLIQTMGVRQ